MSLDLSVVGKEQGPREFWWNSSQTLLYAVGVGCGPDDLEFSTENSRGKPHRVLPTFACVAGQSHAFAAPPEEDVPEGADDLIDLGFGKLDPTAIRHAGHKIELAGPLPTAARAKSWSSVSGIWDKGHAALIEVQSRTHDARTGELLYRQTAYLFVIGEGGFGGGRGPSAASTSTPDRSPDDQVTYHTSEIQPYIYRLAHGRHQMHSDPVFAADAGLPGPILAGMCTYGYTGRAILDVLCDRDPSRFVSMEARFSAPVFPGDDLIVKIWTNGANEARFVTETQRGEVALSRGHCRFK